MTLKRNFGEKGSNLQRQWILSLWDDHTDALRKIRDCRPRLSKSPNPEEAGYPVEGCDTPKFISDPPEIIAKEAYDTLIQMGGRPTRPIRPVPPWKKVLIWGDLCYRYAEEIEVLFYSTWHGNSPGLNSSLTEADYIAAHWEAECRQFREELRRWQDFLDTQQWRRKHQPEFARGGDIERQWYPHDLDLTASLKKLKDWKEYQVYFQRKIDRCKERIEGARRAVEAIERKDPEVVANKGKVRGRDYGDWLKSIEREREWLAAEEKRLEWVKQQLPAVLSECAASLMRAPTSLREMELRSELEANEVFNALVETGGRPTRPIRPVSDRQERDHTDEHPHILCHWQGECSQFEEELRAWRKYLDYRQKKETDGKSEVQLEERQAAETTTQVDLWKDYRAYQQLEVENTKQWVEFWQRQVEDCQETENRCARQGNGATARRYHSIGEDMKSHVEDARKQVRPAEMRLEWVEQQLSGLLVERAGSTTAMSMSDHLEDQAKLPKRASRSGQTTLDDLKSNRSEKSASRSNHDKKKIRASANSTLGPIHPSRVSKAAGRKAPRRQRQSMTLAEHSDDQNQGPDTTISPLLLANVAPRRSSRLSNNDKRSGALEANLAMDLGKSERSLPIVLRRSDRLSKQKENMRTSSSDTAMNSTLILQTYSLQHFSRSKPKGRRAGNKSDASPAKRCGVSKRQESKFSRKRTRIHNKG